MAMPPMGIASEAGAIARDDQAPEEMVRMMLYLAVLGLLGFGLGAVLRSSAGAVAVLFGVLFVPALRVALLPSSWQATIGPYLPMNAGDTIHTVRHEAHMLQPWAGFGVFCLYAAVALTAGFVLIGRRDA